MSRSDTRIVKAGIKVDVPPIPEWVGRATCPRCKAVVDIGEDWESRVYPNDIGLYETILDNGGDPIYALYVTCPACKGHVIRGVSVVNRGPAWEAAGRRREARTPWSQMTLDDRMNLLGGVVGIIFVAAYAIGVIGWVVGWW